MQGSKTFLSLNSRLESKKEEEESPCSLERTHGDGVSGGRGRRCRAQGSRSRLRGSGFGVQGPGFGFQGLGSTPSHGRT